MRERERESATTGWTKVLFYLDDFSLVKIMGTKLDHLLWENFPTASRLFSIPSVPS